MTTHLQNDIDPIATQEWIDALESLLNIEGNERAQFIIDKLIESAQESGVHIKNTIHTPYKNTILPHQEKQMPNDEGLFNRLKAIIRWNAVAMVLRAGKYAPELGGHIASYASAAILYEVGFNYFYKAQNATQNGDLVYFQGHSSPGIYARAFLEDVFPKNN